MNEIVPRGWKVMSFGDFCIATSEKAGDRKQYEPLSVSKVLGIVPQSQKFNKRVASKNISRYKVLRKGEFAYDPMLLWDGSINQLKSVDVGVVSPAYVTFTLTDMANKTYFRQLLKSNLLAAFYKLISKGTNRRRQKAEFRDFCMGKFPFPPLPEQRQIATILTTVEEVIEKTESQINKLQDLKKGMMQELLTKGIGHTEFKDSPVGRIPISWQVMSLMNLCTKTGDGIHTTPKYANHSDYRFINGNNLKDGEIVFGENTKYVPVDEYQKYKKALTERTILMSINGTIGNLAFFDNEHVVLGKSAAYLNIVDSVEKLFLYYVLDSERMKRYFEFELTGTTIRNLSLASIRNAPVALPHRREQNEIAYAIKSVDELIGTKKNMLSAISELKKALMQDLLTGKVRVTVN